MAFNPNEHLTKLQGKDYLEVKWRLVWFRELNPQGTIDTEELEYDAEREVEAEVSVWNPEKRKSEKVLKRAKGYARYRAIVTDGKGARATGTKSENAASFSDYGEKAETGSIGRALAALGYGTQFTGDEFYEGERIVDSPVERYNEARTTQTNGNGNLSTTSKATSAQSQQQESPSIEEIHALCDEVYGPGKWGAVKVRIFDPERYGDIADEMLSPAQRIKAHGMLIQRQKALAKADAAASTAGGK